MRPAALPHRPRTLGWLVVLLAAACFVPGPAAGGASRYGVHVQRDVPVELRDGTVLRADVYSPADRASGRPAEGRFPLLLTQTPYTKTVMASRASDAGGANADPGFFVPRGYIVVLADVRGTGGSTPYHPHTRESTRPLARGKALRLHVEVFPTFARLAAGHRLRLTLTTSDTPHLLPSAPQLAELAGGTYRVHRGARAGSTLRVPLAAADAYAAGCGICSTP